MGHTKFLKKVSASLVRFKSQNNKAEPKPVDDYAHRTWFSADNKKGQRKAGLSISPGIELDGGLENDLIGLFRILAKLVKIQVAVRVGRSIVHLRHKALILIRRGQLA